MHFLYLLFTIFFFSVSGIAQGLESDVVTQFKKETRRNLFIYSKVGSSGCITKIKFRKNSSKVSFVHGFNCSQRADSFPSTESISSALLEIIKFYNLELEIKKRSTLAVYFWYKIPNWHLVRYINMLNSWPANYKDGLKSKKWDSSTENEYFRKSLAEVIKSSNIFSPVKKLFYSLKCSIVLKEYFAEHLFPASSFIEGNKLVQLGVLEKTQKRKTIYPYIEDAISYHISCTKK